MTSATKRFVGTIAFLAVLGVVLGLAQKKWGRALPQAELSGLTMGTSWQVKLSGVKQNDIRVGKLQQAFEAELQAVNDEMSTYQEDSLIRAFNALAADASMEVGERFRQVFLISKEVWRLTGGAFEPTLGPLVNLWGFGHGKVTERPSEEAVAAALAVVGFDKVVEKEGRIFKTVAGVQLDFSAVAKGFAVDRLLELAVEAGFENVYVEIGGEVRCLGLNARAKPWRIGVQVPVVDSAQSGDAIRVVALADRALATSGDYRNFREVNGEWVSHILDPRSGRPVGHRLASVSVLAGHCATADALATGLYVLGAERGLQLIEQAPGIDALFIVRKNDDTFEVNMTQGFRAALLLPERE